MTSIKTRPIPVRLTCILCVEHVLPFTLQKVLAQWAGLHAIHIFDQRTDLDYTSLLANPAIHVHRADFSSSFPAHDFLGADTTHVFVMNDNAALCCPDIEALAQIDNSTLAIVSLLDQPTSSRYSSTQTNTPDHYIHAPCVPVSQIHLLESLRGEPVDAWWGHHMCLAALNRGLKIKAVGHAGALLPALYQVKGWHLGKIRQNSHALIQAFSAFKAGTPDVQSQARIALDALNALAGLAPEEQKSFKACIDQFLSNITADLLAHISPLTSTKTIAHPDLKAKKVAVLNIASLGDVVLASAFMARLQAAAPKQITLFTTDTAAPLFEADTTIEVYGIAEEEKLAAVAHDAPRRLDALLQALVDKLSTFDVAIFPRHYPEFSFAVHLAQLAGIPIRIGIHNTRADEGAYYNPLHALMLSHAITVDAKTHESRKISALADCFDAPVSPPALTLEGITPYEHCYAPYIVVGLGAGCPSRRWPLEHYKEILTSIHAETRLAVVLLGGKDVEQEVREAQLFYPWINNQTGKCDALSSARWIKGAKLYLGHDTGLMHIAAALRIPVVEISKHPRHADPRHLNAPERYGPIDTRHIILQPAYAASPACEKGCIEKAPHCILNISEQEVLDAARILLQGSACTQSQEATTCHDF